MEAAIESCKNKYNFQVTWLPFLLRPNMPEDGVQKPPQYGPNSAGSQRLIKAGQEVGIDFSYKSDKFPNTVPGHCALDYAFQQDSSGIKQNELQELLFKTYFTDGEYLSVDKVSDLAASVGFNRDEVKAFVVHPANIQKVKHKAAQFSNSGVSGVPAFFMNGAMTFSGAQDSENFEKMFDTIISKFGGASL